MVVSLVSAAAAIHAACLKCGLFYLDVTSFLVPENQKIYPALHVHLQEKEKA